MISKISGNDGIESRAIYRTAMRRELIGGIGSIFRWCCAKFNVAEMLEVISMNKYLK
jgi:hypothetical protein